MTAPPVQELILQNVGSDQETALRIVRKELGWIVDAIKPRRDRNPIETPRKCPEILIEQADISVDAAGTIALRINAEAKARSNIVLLDLTLIIPAKSEVDQRPRKDLPANSFAGPPDWP